MIRHRSGPQRECPACVIGTLVILLSVVTGYLLLIWVTA